MVIGAHVSPAGGLPNAISRGVDRECDAIQIFSQSPRAWKPTNHSEESVAEFRSQREGSRIGPVLIHAVYLLNCASDDAELREKSLQGLVNCLEVGDRIGADGVVLHPGSAKDGDPAKAIVRAGKVIAEALKRTESCELHLEDTAGAGGTLGRSFKELGDLINAAKGHERLGVCLDSCHLFASGYDVKTTKGVDEIVAECKAEIGLDRLRSLHINDSVTEFGSNRDRHAAPGEGLIGAKGLGIFMSHPKLQGLPAILEGPGTGGAEAQLEDVRNLRKIHKAGLKARAK